MKQLVTVENISKKWKDFSLNNISFSLEEGRIMEVIGEQGAGKSTLLQILLGGYAYDQKKDAKILIEQYDMKTEADKGKQKLGYILSDCPMILGFSAMENGRILGGGYDTFKKEEFSHYLKCYQIPENLPIYKLSKDQKILLQLAFALSYDGDVYVIDEIAEEISKGVLKELCQTVKHWANEKKAVIYAAEKTGLWELVSDDVLILDQGKLKVCEARKQLLKEYQIVSATNKQLLYIRQMLPNYRVIGVDRGKTEVLLKGEGKLPLNLLQRVPTMAELLSYYKNCNTKEKLCFFEEEESRSKKEREKNVF